MTGLHTSPSTCATTRNLVAGAYALLWCAHLEEARTANPFVYLLPELVLDQFQVPRPVYVHLLRLQHHLHLFPIQARKRTHFPFLRSDV